MCLGDLKDRRAVEPMLKALERGKPGWRGSEIRALVQLEDERVLPALLRILGSDDPQDASFAASALRTSRFAVRTEVVAALAKYDKR